MTTQFDGRPIEIGGEQTLPEKLFEMEKGAKAIRDSAVKFRMDSELDYAQVTLLAEIAARLEMIYLILRGGIDGKKEE